VNAEKAVISGKSKMVVDSYKLLFEVGTLRNPYKHKIKRPRNPVSIVKRAIRGMLPMDKPKGREAFKRLRVFIGVPPELANKEFETLPEAHYSRLARKYMTVYDLAIRLGWNPKVSST